MVLVVVVMAVVVGDFQHKMNVSRAAVPDYVTTPADLSANELRMDARGNDDKDIPSTYSGSKIFQSRLSQYHVYREQLIYNADITPA